MSLLPARFLFRICHPCQFLDGVPREDDDRLLELPESCRIDNFAAMDGKTNFADIRMAWNTFGLACQVEVKGKDQPVQGSSHRPRGSDGLTLWIDTRDARTSHRASRYCHQFHVLPTGGGKEEDEPHFAQSKINRALQEAPVCNASQVPFRSERTKRGYILELFLPAAALNGFEPEQNPRLGFYYAVHDTELGDQTLSLGMDFPYWEDPTLWGTLELVKGK